MEVRGVVRGWVGVRKEGVERERSEGQVCYKTYKYRRRNVMGGRDPLFLPFFLPSFTSSIPPIFFRSKSLRRTQSTLLVNNFSYIYPFMFASMYICNTHTYIHASLYAYLYIQPNKVTSIRTRTYACLHYITTSPYTTLIYIFSFFSVSMDIAG